MSATETSPMESTLNRGSRVLPPRDEMVRAMLVGDGTFDGVFVTAVRTTGIFCLPSCRPPRRPNPEPGHVAKAVRAAGRPGRTPPADTVE